MIRLMERLRFEHVPHCRKEREGIGPPLPAAEVPFGAVARPGNGTGAWAKPGGWAGWPEGLGGRCCRVRIERRAREQEEEHRRGCQGGKQSQAGVSGFMARFARALDSWPLR